MDGDNYFQWLSDASSPVIVNRCGRSGEEGVGFSIQEPKGEVRGFVSFRDMAESAARNPQLAAQARVFQRAFALGLARGLEEGLARPVGQQIILPEAPPIGEAALEAYKSDWDRGWKRGFQYGYCKLVGTGFHSGGGAVFTEDCPHRSRS